MCAFPIHDRCVSGRHTDTVCPAFCSAQTQLWTYGEAGPGGPSSLVTRICIDTLFVLLPKPGCKLMGTLTRVTNWFGVVPKFDRRLRGNQVVPVGRVKADCKNLRQQIIGAQNTAGNWNEVRLAEFCYPSPGMWCAGTTFHGGGGAMGVLCNQSI
jgi:hypothetical protein